MEVLTILTLVLFLLNVLLVKEMWSWGLAREWSVLAPVFQYHGIELFWQFVVSFSFL